MFENCIGIDYSGAGSAVKRNKALQVFMASGTDKLTKVQTDAGVNWSSISFLRYRIQSVNRRFLKAGF